MGLPTLSCTFRTNPEDLKRADALIPYVQTGPLARATRVSRTTVIRIALSYGLDRLEKELGVERAAEKPRPAEMPVQTKPTPVGALIKWRKSEKIGQREAGRRLGISQRLYGRIERGSRTLTADMVSTIVEVAGIQRGDLPTPDDAD